MKEVIIREANIKDYENILKLNFALFKKEYKDYDKTLDMKWTYGRKGKEYFKNRISKNDGFVVVAESRGKIFAYLCGGLRKHSYRIRVKYAELENMIVDKNLRGRGIGKRLAQEFVKWCKAKNVKYVSVTASVGNIPGISFYRSLGFNDYNLTLEKKL